MLIFFFFQALSDLLLGVFCMPFTLVGQVLRNFIFGAAMCKLIPYFQGECFNLSISVVVNIYTLSAKQLQNYIKYYVVALEAFAPEKGSTESFKVRKFIILIFIFNT